MATRLKIKELRAGLKTVTSLSIIRADYMNEKDRDLENEFLARAMKIVFIKVKQNLAAAKTVSALHKIYSDFEGHWVTQAMAGQKQRGNTLSDKVCDLYQFHFCKFLKKELKSQISKLGRKKSGPASEKDQIKLSLAIEMLG